jgi:hypothetical protein
MASATYDDVNLILKLYELRRDPKLREARDWFGSQLKARTFSEFLEQCPPGSQGNVYVRMVSSYWDMVASFIVSGVLNEELFFQSGGEMLGCWVKLREIVPDMREMMKNPFIAKNLEEVAGRYATWLNKHAPGAFEAMITAMTSQANAPRS